MCFVDLFIIDGATTGRGVTKEPAIESDVYEYE